MENHVRIISSDDFVTPPAVQAAIKNYYSSKSSREVFIKVETHGDFFRKIDGVLRRVREKYDEQMYAIYEMKKGEERRMFALDANGN